jgi:flagellar motor protein MotB
LERDAQAQEAAVASHRAALEAQKAEELRQAEEQHALDLAQAEAAAEAERLQALADAEAERLQALADAARGEQEALDQLQASLAADKEKALEASERAFAEELDQQKDLTARAKQQLTPYVKAAEAKQQIVDLLNENFKDYDASAVEIDDKTGKVRLNFQESYFIRGSHELSEEMKDFLRIMIPKYAQSIYENEKAAELVESLKISGMTSPVYMGRYIDINDTSPRSERARQYNMALSNRRAVAMYNFIFDAVEMGNYRYRTRLKKDMGIAALGFQNAQPVRDDLVGKDADCIEYNCQKEQATILQFQLYTEESASF